MTHLHSSLGLALLGIVPLPSPGNRAEGLRNLKIGQDFPAFELETKDGKSITNTAIQGKPAVVLYLSPQQRGSERAARETHRIVASMKRKVAVVYATAETGKAGYFEGLWKRLGITEPLGLDTKRKLYAKLGLIVFPTTMIVDKEGKLAHVITERGVGYTKALDAYLRFETGEWDKAKLVKVLKTEDPHLRTPKSMASRYRVSARLLWKKGLLDAAEKELRKALAISPEDPEIQLSLVELLMERKNLDDAFTAIQALRKQWGEHKRAQVIHGILLFKLEQPAKAKKILLKSLELNPDPSATHYYLGRIYEAEGDKDKALEHYRKSAEELLRDF